MLPLRYGRVWLFAGWAGVLGAAIVSLTPGTSVMSLPLSDKLIHALVYLVLMLWFGGIYRRRRYLPIAASLFALGVALEFLQTRVGRDRSALDMLANLTGILVGLALAWHALGGWCVKAEGWLRAR